MSKLWWILVCTIFRSFTVGCRLVSIFARTLCSRIRTWRNLLQAITTFLCSGCLPPTKHFHFAVQIQQSEDFCLFCHRLGIGRVFACVLRTIVVDRNFRISTTWITTFGHFAICLLVYPRTHETGNKEYAADWVLTVRLMLEQNIRSFFVCRNYNSEFTQHNSRVMSIICEMWITAGGVRSNRAAWGKISKMLPWRTENRNYWSNESISPLNCMLAWDNTIRSNLYYVSAH